MKDYLFAYEGWICVRGLDNKKGFVYIGVAMANRNATTTDAIREHRRKLRRQGWHEESLKPGPSIDQLYETELVNQQLEDNKDAFTEEADKLAPGHSRTPEYRTWISLKARCLNPNDKGFKNYGGRGIRVCDRWLGSYANFYADMGARPSGEHSIDRIDNNGNYEPGNCRWTTATEQQRNTRWNRLVTIKGETKTMSEWHKIYGLKGMAFRRRIEKGMNPEQALEETIELNKLPVDRRHSRKLSYDDYAVIRGRFSRGELQPHIAKDYGVTQSAISRIVTGVTDAKPQETK